MPDTKADIVLHFVWRTKNGYPWIVAERRRALHNCIVGQATDLGCRTLAIGGVDDHVHLLVAIPTTVSAAEVAHQVKGVSSHFCKDRLGWSGFYWQDGYGVFSVSRSHVTGVVAYIQNQEQHHAAGTTWVSCEQAGENEVGGGESRGSGRGLKPPPVGTVPPGRSRPPRRGGSDSRGFEPPAS